MNEVIHELSFEEVAKKYPDFPRTVIRKIDTSLRGVILTEKALEGAKEEGAFYDVSHDLGRETHKPVLGEVFFRDGTYLLGLNCEESRLKGKPYFLDLIDGKLWLLDGENLLEEVYFAPVPAFFRKKTSRGTPMIKVISSKVPNRISINIFTYCQFFREKLPCKYCSYMANGSFSRRKDEIHTPESLEDIYETVNEILEEEGKWTNINLISGSDPRGMHQSGAYRGNSPYENEVNEYIKVLKTLQRCFATQRIPAVNRNGSPSHQTVQGSLPVNAIASAFPREQQLRLKEAGLAVYISNIEVWDKKLFEWICPGKAKYFGRQYWIDSILSAVEIFGRGNVSTQLVAGAELAEPYGFKEMDEALASNLEGVEFFARNGVYTTFCILWVDRGSVFYREKQKLPPLEYYVKLAQGINKIRKKYNLNASYSGYRGDGFHLDMDLARLAP